ncbi:S phase cyclin A-associated protein in the endoplasmic reticulum-like [Sarcoptes scabiei]|nr:S phase cyclin A-associated protein in the endoplasmic reticulum-like [Sarcoptes scabiei]
MSSSGNRLEQQEMKFNRRTRYPKNPSTFQCEIFYNNDDDGVFFEWEFFVQCAYSNSIDWNEFFSFSFPIRLFWARFGTYFFSFLAGSFQFERTQENNVP